MSDQAVSGVTDGVVITLPEGVSVDMNSVSGGGVSGTAVLDGVVFEDTERQAKRKRRKERAKKVATHGTVGTLAAVLSYLASYKAPVTQPPTPVESTEPVKVVEQIDLKSREAALETAIERAVFKLERKARDRGLSREEADIYFSLRDSLKEKVLERGGKGIDRN